MAKTPRKPRATLESKLQAALTEAGRRKQELLEAEDKLKPLRKLYAKTQASAQKLLAKYAQESGLAGVAVKTGRRGPRKGKKRSPEVREKMAAAQRKRWAALKRAK